MEAEKPEKPDKPNRDKRIDIRVTADEKKRIVANAEAAGMDASEFLRELGFDKEVKAPKPADERRALVGIANNLNQVARRINSGHDASQWVPQLTLMLARLDEYFL